MLLRSLPRLLAPVCYLAVAACAVPATRSAQTIDVNTEFTLSQLGKAKVKNSDVEVQFMGITEDSRCPRGVACISVGQAKVRLNITAGRGEAVLRDVLEQQTVIADKYQIKVLRVLPLPVANAKIPAGEYQVTLSVACNRCS